MRRVWRDGSATPLPRHGPMNKNAGVVRAARAELGLSQAGFGAWLAEQTGRDHPYSYQQVSDWEAGRRRPRLNVRQACAPVAARAVAEMAVTVVAAKCGRRVWTEMPADLARLRDKIAAWIVEATS